MRCERNQHVPAIFTFVVDVCTPPYKKLGRVVILILNQGQVWGHAVPIRCFKLSTTLNQAFNKFLAFPSALLQLVLLVNVVYLLNQLLSSLDYQRSITIFVCLLGVNLVLYSDSVQFRVKILGRDFN